MALLADSLASSSVSCLANPPRVYSKRRFLTTFFLLLLILLTVVYQKYLKDSVQQYWDLYELRYHVIDPTLRNIGMDSEAAENLLYGTALQESCGGRIASNVFQMKETTASDLQKNYLNYHPALSAKVAALYDNTHPLQWNVDHNVPYQVALARVLYERFHQPLPDPNDSLAMGSFWKKYYNTVLGAGKPEQFANIYDHPYFEYEHRCMRLKKVN